MVASALKAQATHLAVSSSEKDLVIKAHSLLQPTAIKQLSMSQCTGTIIHNLVKESIPPTATVDFLSAVKPSSSSTVLALGLLRTSGEAVRKMD